MKKVKVAVLVLRNICGGRDQYKAFIDNYRDGEGINFVEMLVDKTKKGWKHIAKERAVKELKYGGDEYIYCKYIGDEWRRNSIGDVR